MFFCLNYSFKLNLWGDEAYSLNLIEKSWQQIYSTVDVHLPTYYFGLKVLTSIFEITNELTLRLIHAAVFSAGLFVGYQIVFRLSNSGKKALSLLLVSIVSPSFIFYATNLRMYAPLFLLAMIYLFYLIKFFRRDLAVTKKDWFLYSLSSSALILSDYPGIILFLVGSALLAWKLVEVKKIKLISLSLTPLLTLVVYLPLLLTLSSSFLNRKLTSFPIPNLSFLEFGKLIYERLNPSFDLFVVSQPNPFLALVVPVLFTLGLFVNNFIFLSQKKFQTKFNLVIVVTLGFYWILAIPFGQIASRVFLPSLFFLPACLLFMTPFLPKFMNRVNIILLFCLFGSSLLQVIQPTLRFYSLIPYKSVASETLKLAQTENTNHILLTDNSLNQLSIRRYIDKSKSSRIQTMFMPTKLGAVLPDSFILVSHLGESRNFFNVKKLEKKYQVRPAKKYIELASLPFNSVRKTQIKDRAFQDYAIILYIVNKNGQNKI